MPKGQSFGSTPHQEPKRKIELVCENDHFTITPLSLEAEAEDVVRWRAKGDKAWIKFRNRDVFGILELNLEKDKYKDLQISKTAAKVPHIYEARMGVRTLSSGGVDPDIIIR